MATTMTGGQQLGTDQGKGKGVSTGSGTGADKLALFLKVFGGEVLTAFARTSVTTSRHMVRSISSGKSAQFPVLGRTQAAYLQPGENLDDIRKDIKHTEKVITIDGLLTADVLIYDIEDAMNHYDVRSEYTSQLGESLAMAADGAVLAEIAGLCNLASASNENIEGLGAATVIDTTQDKTALTDQVALGKEIIAALTKARAALTKNYVPASDRVFYCDPDSYSAILAALMPNAANYAALIDPEKGSIRNVMGFEVVEVPHLTAGGAGTSRADTTGQKHAFPASNSGGSGNNKVTKDNVIGLFMHRSAVGTVKLRDLALERARRANFQADQIIAKYAMGHGGLRPEAAGAVVFKTK